MALLRRLDIFGDGAERLEGSASQISAGHLHGGQGRIDELGEMDVVEADDRHVFGNLESGAGEHAESADRRHIVGAHDGGGSFGQRQQMLHGVHAALEGVIALDQPLGVGANTDLFHRLDEGDLAGLGRTLAERPADKGDVAVAESSEMLHALADSLAVVDDESAHERTGRAGIDEDHGDVARAELLEQRLLDAEGHDGDAFDVALEHAADTGGHAGEVVVGGADEDFVSVGDGDFFEALDELGEKRVGDLGDEQAEEACAS